MGKDQPDKFDNKFDFYTQVFRKLKAQEQVLLNYESKLLEWETILVDWEDALHKLEKQLGAKVSQKCPNCGKQAGKNPDKTKSTKRDSHEVLEDAFEDIMDAWTFFTASDKVPTTKRSLPRKPDVLGDTVEWLKKLFDLKDTRTE